MLWDAYVFRRGLDVVALWDDLFRERTAKLLFITGSGFDARVAGVLQRFTDASQAGGYKLRDSRLLLIEFSGYDLSQELKDLTQTNRAALHNAFASLGEIVSIPVRLTGGVDHQPTAELRSLNLRLRDYLEGNTDIIIDVSSLPRVVYLSLITGSLAYLIPDANVADAKFSAGINLQILVAEDPNLDSKIRSEDPSQNLITIPGFGGGFNVASMDEWPVVWFPVLGEGRTSHFEMVRRYAPIPDEAEICPVLPHPSRTPRRGDMLLLEYRRQLFDVQSIPTTNIVYAHEANPFEAYRQLLRAMDRYRNSLSVLGGSRLLVTPLASKLMTIATGLACFEMKAGASSGNYTIGIPYAAPTSYTVSAADLTASQPVVCSLVLTGDAYRV